MVQKMLSASLISCLFYCSLDQILFHKGPLLSARAISCWIYKNLTLAWRHMSTCRYLCADRNNGSALLKFFFNPKHLLFLFCRYWCSDQKWWVSLSLVYLFNPKHFVGTGVLIRWWYKRPSLLSPSLMRRAPPFSLDGSRQACKFITLKC